MAKRNGTSADVQKAVEEAKALAERHDELLSEREETQRRINAIDAELNVIEGRSAKFVGKTKSGKTKQSKTKSGNGKTRKRATGPKPDDVLLMSVLPTRDEASAIDDGGGMSREEMTEKASKAGWQTYAEQPDVVIGQALGRLKKSRFATTAQRGRWHLTANGEKKRAKMLAEAQEGEEVAA